MNYIKNEISIGTLRLGDMIYSESQLMKKFNVSRHTVRAALNKLTAENIIYTEHGKGSFVKWEESFSGVEIKTSKTIYVIVSYLNNHLKPQIVDAIENLASRSGYNIILKCTHNRVFKERQCLIDITNTDIAGVIIEPSKSALPSINLDLYEQLNKRRIPIVFIHGCISGFSDNYVVANDEKAGYDAAMHLINNGHKMISGVFKSDDIQGLLRYKGMMRAIVHSGLEPDENEIFWLSTQDEKEIIQNKVLHNEYFKRLEKTTATICYNDDIALIIADILFEQGLSVPENHSLVSFDNTPFGDAYRVSITSMDHPKAEIGRYAFEGLMELMQNPNENYRRMIDVDIVVKNSVKKI